MRRTRQAARNELNASVSLSTTPTIGASPVFSAETSPQITPDTSEPDEDEKPLAKRARPLKANTKFKGKKREIESETEDAVVTKKQRRAVYVEITTQKAKVNALLLLNGA